VSREYREEVVIKYEAQISKTLSHAPNYIKDFYDHMHNGRREISTQFAYVRDIIMFIDYMRTTIPFFKETELKDFPIDVFNQLTVKDMNEYRTYLHDIQFLSNSSIKKKFAAISAFYKFAKSEGYTTNSPLDDFEQPAINKKRIIKLDAAMSNQLLEGILRNDMYLANTVDGERPLPIPEQVYIKREPLVLRNYAICCLFLGSGLRVSELVGLDLDDISFTQGSLNIIAKGGDEIQVYFGEEVARALMTYINGTPLPTGLVEKYAYTHSDAVEWCKSHLLEVGFKDKLISAFPGHDKAFYSDLTMLAASMRRQGRNGLKPLKNCDAVFISSRGKRMTVRMVQLMIKEMVKTYLPDFDDKDIFSPHKLRTTCATRILTQTGDIQLASTQLNHKGIAVTAAFYAELQKEKQRDKVRSLDMNDW
jgi:site-specific recombinase XerD